MMKAGAEKLRRIGANVKKITWSGCGCSKKYRHSSKGVHEDSSGGRNQEQMHAPSDG